MVRKKKCVMLFERRQWMQSYSTFFHNCTTYNNKESEKQNNVAETVYYVYVLFPTLQL